MNNKKGKYVKRAGWLVAFMFLSACATAPNRNPANNTADDEQDTSSLVSTEFKQNVNIQDATASGGQTVPAMACGQLFHGESSYTALNDEDAFYFLRLRCDGGNPQFVKFDKNSMSPQRRGVLTRYMGKAAKLKKTRRTAPLVCFRGVATAKPCEGNKTIVVTSVQNFTSNEKTYRGWTESK